MQETLNTILTTLKELSWQVQIVLCICVLAGFLAFVHYGGLTASSEPETAPTATTKTVEVGQIQGNINGGINLSQ